MRAIVPRTRAERRAGAAACASRTRRELDHDPVVHGHDQRVEVVEALVEVARVEPGLLAHGADGRPGPALGAQQVEARVDQELTAVGPPIGGGDPAQRARDDRIAGRTVRLATGVTKTRVGP